MRFSSGNEGAGGRSLERVYGNVPSASALRLSFVWRGGQVEDLAHSHRPSESPTCTSSFTGHAAGTASSTLLPLSFAFRASASCEKVV